MDETINRNQIEEVNMRKFGIEIEAMLPSSRTKDELADYLNNSVNCRSEGYNHTTQTYWKVVTDASLPYGGIEVVSPVLEGDNGMRDLKLVLQEMLSFGCTVNRSCGIHIHQDASDFDASNLKALVMLYSKCEKSIDSIMPKSRRSSQWAKKLTRVTRSKNPTEIWEKISHDSETDINTVAQMILPNRYCKLNTQAYRVHGTIEFRQHGGSLDFEKIASWIMLTNAMMNWAKDNNKYAIDRRHSPKFKWLMKHVGEAKCDFNFLPARNYLEARKQHFQTQA